MPGLNRQPRLDAPDDAEHAGAAARTDTPALRVVPGAPRMPDPPVLDLQVLARLGQLDPTGRSRLLQRVLQAFQASLLRWRPNIDAARHGGDRSVLRLAAHTLKSSSASLGAMQLAQLCAEIERALDTDSDTALAPRLDALDTAFAQALQVVAQQLEERP